MQSALEELLKKAIDYAGLFPPAQLSMAHAVANYDRYSSGPENWVQARFVCSAIRLGELLQDLRERSQPKSPIPVAVVGTSGPNFSSSLEIDLLSIRQFAEHAGAFAEIEAFEVRVPDHKRLASYIRDLQPLEELDLFVELPWDEALPDSLATLAAGGAVGAKARTGGLTPDAFPTASELANFVQSCLHLDLPFKCTAGLHHPLPVMDPATGGRMHGFLNVMLAAAFGLAEDLSRREIEEILSVSDLDSFVFSREHVRWRSHQATREQISESRHLMVGFGSCSIEEPLAELAPWATLLPTP